MSCLGKKQPTVVPATSDVWRTETASLASPSHLNSMINETVGVNTDSRCKRTCRATMLPWWVTFPFTTGDPITTSGKRNQMIKMLTIILIPVCILVGLTGNSFITKANSYLRSNSIRSTLRFSLDMAHMISALQRERSGSALYLSSIRPETKGFLLNRYVETDEAVQNLPEWPTTLTDMPGFDTRENFMKLLNQHRYELDTLEMTFHEELITYTSWIEVFIRWFYKSITEARSESEVYMRFTDLRKVMFTDAEGGGGGEHHFSKVWKAFVAYQELIIAREYIGRERAMGVIFYTLGEFPTREEYLYFVQSQGISNSSFAAARQYSTVAKRIYDAKTKGNPAMMKSIQQKRSEIRSRNRNSASFDRVHGSLIEALFWFENMSYFQDIIGEAQVQLAITIDDVLARRQYTDLINIVIICIIFSTVLILCPIIIYAVYHLTTEIQMCAIHIEDRTKTLSQEKKRTDMLLYQMLPRTIVERLKQNLAVPTEVFSQATVMFSDIVGFTQISTRSSPLQIVDMLNCIYSCLDERIELYDVYKVETIGDAYLVVSGVPKPNDMLHASEICSLAIDMLEQVDQIEIPHLPDTSVRLRIGCHSGTKLLVIQNGPNSCTTDNTILEGSVVAGVVGTKMPHYCVFGETVNVAARLEALGTPSMIHLSHTTAKILTEVGGYLLEPRGHFPEKTDHDLMTAFRGSVETYWLLGKQTTQSTCSTGNIIQNSPN